MGFPKFRKINTNEEYIWEFNILEPLTPIRFKMQRRYFENLNTHPSGKVVGVSSVGTRDFDYPSSQLFFPLNMEVTVKQCEQLLQFFSASAFWFFPDSEVNIGYLVTYFPNEFSPSPRPSSRFLIEGELQQLGRSVNRPEIDTGIELEISNIQYSQQSYITSGISMWTNDKEGIDSEASTDDNQLGIYILPESESLDSDWILLDNHIIRHETNYFDRYGRLMFNWVRSVKRRYLLHFDFVDEDFIQKLSRFVGMRKGRFYPIVDTSLADDTLTGFILPPQTEGIPYMNVRVIDVGLPVEHGGGYYSAYLTFEEI